MVGHRLHREGMHGLEQDRANPPDEHGGIAVHPDDLGVVGEPARTGRAVDPCPLTRTIRSSDALEDPVPQTRAEGVHDFEPTSGLGAMGLDVSTNDTGDLMNSTRASDPLKVLENVVGLVVIVMSLLTCAVLLGTVAGSGSIPGVTTEVCVSTSEGGMPGFRRAEGEQTGPTGLSEGVTWRAEEIKICDPDPATATRALAAIGLLVWVGAPLLFFGLLWRMLRRARREGVFADRVPGALRQLGGLLLVWAALDFVVTGFVNGVLLRSMTEDLVFFTSSEFPWLLVLLGIALLALARVMGEAVLMRHEVEATI